MPDPNEPVMIIHGKKTVTYKGATATLHTAQGRGNQQWAIEQSGKVVAQGNSLRDLMAIMDAGDLKMSGGRRRKTRKSRRHLRKTRRSRK